MSLSNTRVSLFLASLLISSLALAATPPAPAKATGATATTVAVDCSKDKNGKKATAAQVKKCEDKAKAAAKY